MLKRKLRLRLWPLTHLTHCMCTAKLDPHGDHCLGCTYNHKTTASDCIRDVIVMILKSILPLVQLIRQQSQVETEPTRIIKYLPSTQTTTLRFSLPSGTLHYWSCVEMPLKLHRIRRHTNTLQHFLFQYHKGLRFIEQRWTQRTPTWFRSEKEFWKTPRQYKQCHWCHTHQRSSNRTDNWQ